MVSDFLSADRVSRRCADCCAAFLVIQSNIREIMKSTIKLLVGPAIVLAVNFACWTFRRQLFPRQESTAAAESKSTLEPDGKQTVLEISEQARKNLSLVSKAVRPQSYWRTVVIPGEVADRPGISDRGVTSPAVGVVTAIHAFPGDTMRPGEALFTLRKLTGLTGTLYVHRGAAICA